MAAVSAPELAFGRLVSSGQQQHGPFAGVGCQVLRLRVFGHPSEVVSHAPDRVAVWHGRQLDRDAYVERQGLAEQHNVTHAGESEKRVERVALRETR
jgi:hypothetical protein